MGTVRENLVGQTIAGYELQRELGHGAMGVVYKALEKNLHRTVALKLLSTRLADKESEVQGFYKEARAAAKINHPNVVTIFTVGSEEKRHFIAMEYVQGRTLWRTIERKGHLKVDEALTIAKQVAEALESAHKQKIIHRDIKPHNIMIDEEGRPRVMDFGIARIRDAHMTQGDEAEWIGTPAYLSPEQCEGKPTDHRADIYALGVTLFEMLAGRTPYVLSDRSMLKKMIIESPIPSIRRFNRDVPYSVVKILEKALAKDPNQRYSSCFEMKEDLERALNGLDVTANSHANAATEVNATGGFSTSTPSSPFAPPPPAGPPPGARGKKSSKPLALAEPRKQQPSRAAEDDELWGGPRAGGGRDWVRPALKWGSIGALALLVAVLALMFIRRSGSEELRRFVGHRGDVFSVALSSDGKTMVSGGADRTARLWRVDGTGGLPFMDSFMIPRQSAYRILSKHTAGVQSAAFSPDGKLCLTGGADKTVRLWDAVKGNEIRVMEGHQDFVWSVAFSPDGKHAISGGADMALILWDAENGKALARLRGHTATVRSVAFSPYGRLAVSGAADKTIRVWDVGARSLARKLEGHEDEVLAVRFSPDGNRIASGGRDNTVRIWDADTGKPIRTLAGHEDDVCNVRFSRDGKRIVSAGWDGMARVWNVADGKEVARVGSPSTDALDAEFLPGGVRIISAHTDGTIRLWNIGAAPPPAQAAPAKTPKK